MNSSKRLLKEDGVNSCYCDESGMGKEPIATMVGIIVDAGRMHKTKKDWADLLRILSNLTGKTIVELHTADFYGGNGVWRNMDGPQRANVIDAIFDWLIDRKHHLVYSSVNKNSFNAGISRDIPGELDRVWQFLGFHVALAVQKYSQPEDVPKGNTWLIFDNEDSEKRRYIDLIKNPPAWSDGYYARKKKQSTFDQIIDVPHFADSKDIGLLQVADFLAFFLRRYAEIREDLSNPDYSGETIRLNGWIQKFQKRVIPQSNIYPKVGRKFAHELFFKYGAQSLRNL